MFTGSGFSDGHQFGAQPYSEHCIRRIRRSCRHAQLPVAAQQFAHRFPYARYLDPEGAQSECYLFFRTKLASYADADEKA